MSIQEDPEDISEESKTIGQKLYSYFVEINNALECTSEEHREDKDETNISDEELFTYESGQEDDATALSAESSVEESESEEDKNIPFSAKCKVVSLSEQHPAWSLKSLQTKGSKFLKSRMQLTRWRRQVSQGGSRKDKMKRIDTYVYSKFCEARDEKRRMIFENNLDYCNNGPWKQDVNFWMKMRIRSLTHRHVGYTILKLDIASDRGK
ncbi:uncharacterized protein LOC117612002 [Osmia lignaria lignaria]|uniref:uncharacterized protein LOC117612002 n=1 Tax=Osmia lignaria lignaria TaxID=1437193 RepID=UPI00402BAA5B